MIEWEDRCLRNDKILFDCVMKENYRQLNKWNIQIRTPFEWLTYLTEEVGELAQAISEQVYRKGSKDNVFVEAIQTATLALKIAEMSIPKAFRTSSELPPDEKVVGNKG